MILIDIDRLETSENGTVGVFRINKRVEGFSLELPNLHNERNISCIPAGQYKGRLLYKDHSGHYVHIYHVPGRSGIQIHAGNTIHDTDGCILVGEGLQRDTGVVNSAILTMSRICIRKLVPIEHKYDKKKFEDECLISVRWVL